MSASCPCPRPLTHPICPWARLPPCPSASTPTPTLPVPLPAPGKLLTDVKRGVKLSVVALEAALAEARAMGLVMKHCQVGGSGSGAGGRRARAAAAAGARGQARKGRQGGGGGGGCLPAAAQRLPGLALATS